MVKSTILPAQDRIDLFVEPLESLGFIEYYSRIIEHITEKVFRKEVALGYMFFKIECCVTYENQVLNNCISIQISPFQLPSSYAFQIYLNFNSEINLVKETVACSKLVVSNFLEIKAIAKGRTFFQFLPTYLDNQIIFRSRIEILKEIDRYIHLSTKDGLMIDHNGGYYQRYVYEM